MDLQERTEAFILLGKNLTQIKLCDKSAVNEDNISDLFQVTESNEWFTNSNIEFALQSIANNLTESNIQAWLKQYPRLLTITLRKGLVW